MTLIKIYVELVINAYLTIAIYGMSIAASFIIVSISVPFAPLKSLLWLVEFGKAISLFLEKQKAIKETTP